VYGKFNLAQVRKRSLRRNSDEDSRHWRGRIHRLSRVAEPVFDATVNVIGSVNLLQYAVRTGVQGMLYASTGGAMYGEVQEPATEQAEKRPFSPYGAAKGAVEGYLFAFARTLGLQVVSLRYGNVYGPRQNPEGEAGVVAIFSQAMLSEERPKIYGAGDQLRDYIYVEDVARANLLATDFLLAGHPPPESPNDRTFNIGTGKSTSVNDLFARLKKIIGFSEEPIHADPRAGELMRSCLDVGKAAQELGFKAHMLLTEGLAETVDWIRSSL